MKTIKHPPFVEGSRTHVEHWVCILNWDGTVDSRRVCSETNCELNKHGIENNKTTSRTRT